MKVREVLVKVFEPGRLLMAWQQVRTNAGAAGIDQMTGEEFAQRDEHPLALIHAKLKAGHYRFQPARRLYNCFLPNLMGSATDRRAVYLAGTCRSVGRG